MDSKTSENRRKIDPADRIDSKVGGAEVVSNEVVVHVLLHHPQRPVRANWDGIGKLLAKKTPVKMSPESPKPFMEIPEKSNRRQHLGKTAATIKASTER